MRNDTYIDGNFAWFTGKVEDVNDTKYLNRVKVRCYGWHTDDTSIVKTSDLPWATVMMPSTSPSLKGTGSNHHLEVGSWVVGFFRDGPSAQDPIVMGSIATQEDNILDIPTEAQKSPPTNKVYKSTVGHLIEIDNTSGDERINVKHKSGTTVLIDKDGGVHIDAVNDIVTIDGNTSITGTLHVTGAQTNDSTIVAVDSITGKNVTLDTHTHKHAPGTGGSSSPLPAITETQAPTSGT